MSNSDFPIDSYLERHTDKNEIAVYRWHQNNGEHEDSENFYESTHEICVPLEWPGEITYEWWDYPYGRSGSFGENFITAREAVALVDDPDNFVRWARDGGCDPKWSALFKKEWDRKDFLEQKQREAIMVWENKEKNNEKH